MEGFAVRKFAIKWRCGSGVLVHKAILFLNTFKLKHKKFSLIKTHIATWKSPQPALKPQQFCEVWTTQRGLL
jgi:hypothetical protein